MTSPPENIRANQQEGELLLDWPDGRTTRIGYHALRCACHCAVCVDEHTGQRLLIPEEVPDSIQPEQLSLTGNYALKIRWNDGHDTGLFTWKRLAELTGWSGEQQL